MKQSGKQNMAKKDSNETGKAANGKNPRMRRKKAGTGAQDDDSVDSRGNLRDLIAYDSDDSDDTSLTPEDRLIIKRSARAAAIKAREAIRERLTAESKPARKPAKKSRKVEEEEEEEEEEDEDEEEEDDEEYEDEEEESPGFVITMGYDSEENTNVPKRHNMKKESEIVNKFVNLVTKPANDGGIDDQIEEFKRLSPEKQTDLITVLERRPDSKSDSQSMMFKILAMKVPADTQSLVMGKYNALKSMDPASGEYFKLRSWLEKLTSLPIGLYKEIPVKITDGQETCGAFMERARRALSEAIYGQEESKLQILQFIASKIANPDARGLSLMLAGPPGIGKTSLIKNGIAKALGWPFQFISLGGDSDASTYVGHQLVYEGSHCGKIVNSLVSAKSMSMILMFDELDKISSTAKGEEVQNMLVHLTDPVQNSDFEDKYLSGIPLDLSKVLFTFSANDLSKIDRVLMDRMVVIELKGYTSKEKIAIAENFLWPAALKEVNLDEKIGISRDVLEHIQREYAGDEKGVRELKRCVEAIAQKINMLRIFNTKDLPFHIPNFSLPFVVRKEHVDLFLKKKEGADPSVQGMYT
jgi:MoxR-like ATPase